jgi:large subunit ribosomal protein L25
MGAPRIERGEEDNEDMAGRTAISAEPREVLGKKVKRLRQQGLLPANIYGKGIPSAAIQLNSREFTRTIKEAGVRSMFELSVQGEPQPRHVIVRSLSRKGGTGGVEHVDFYQVDLRRPIQTTALIHLVGEAPAVKDLAGTLLHSLEAVAIRCLPLQIPEAIEADVSGIKNFDVSVTVGDLRVPEGVEILTDPSIVIATVTPPRVRLEGELAPEEEAAAAAEAEATAEGEGEAATEEAPRGE